MSLKRSVHAVNFACQRKDFGIIRLAKSVGVLSDTRFGIKAESLIPVPRRLWGTRRLSAGDRVKAAPWIRLWWRGGPAQASKPSQRSEWLLEDPVLHWPLGGAQRGWAGTETRM